VHLHTLLSFPRLILLRLSVVPHLNCLAVQRVSLQRASLAGNVPGQRRMASPQKISAQHYSPRV